MKRILILSGSPRKSGNSDTLCDEFAKGAKSVGNVVEKIIITQKNIKYCSTEYCTLISEINLNPFNMFD